MIMLMSNGKTTRKITGDDLRRLYVAILERFAARKHAERMTQRMLAGKDGIEPALTA